jgi:hypothetical protein
MRAALLVALAACSDSGPDLITVVDEPRVLAILSEPSVLDVDGEIALAPMTVDGNGPRSGDPVRLRACSPWIFVAEPAIDCAGANALPFEGTLSTAQLLDAFPPPDGSPATPEALEIAIEAGLTPRIPVIAEVEVDGQTLVARRDLRIVVDGSELTDPRLAEVRFDGTVTTALRAGQQYSLTLAFDPESFDPRIDDPEQRLERFDCYFYSPHGELAEHEIDVREPEQSVETPPNRFTAGDAGDSWLFVVVTDRTGGMSADAIPLTID